MKYNSKKFLTVITIICLIIGIAGNSFAHSGRTDSNGGHKDNQNKSGLGSYHYHCGGNPPHLHENGVCTYSSSSFSSSSASGASTNESSINFSSSQSASSESVISTTSSETSSSESSTNSTTSEVSDSESSSSSPSKSNSNDTITTSSQSVESIPTPTSTVKSIIEAKSVKINESITTMKVGETEKLTTTIIPENTEDKSITWSSNDEDIATVSSTGKVVSLKAGMVKITATTENGKTDTIEIMVEEVKEIKEENNTIVAPIQSNKLNNTSDNNTEESNAITGVFGLGLIGGGVYWIYKKLKK